MKKKQEGIFSVQLSAADRAAIDALAAEWCTSSGAVVRWAVDKMVVQPYMEAQRKAAQSIETNANGATHA